VACVEKERDMHTLIAPIPWPRRREPIDKEAAESCFGLGCARRGSCWRYRAVELVAAGSTTPVSCLRDGAYPRYIAVDAARG
jgi:hypothetical protein